MIRIGLVPLALVVVVFCASCTSPPNVDTVHVSGTVTQGGKPLEPKSGGGESGEEPYVGYQVRFIPKQGVDAFVANVMAGGKYELDLPPGDYKVEVRPYDETGGMEASIQEGGGQQEAQGDQVLKTLEVQITSSQELNIEI